MTPKTLTIRQGAQQERWLPVGGFEGRYDVSDLGRVRSLPRKHVPKLRVLKGRPNTDGYVGVALYDGASPKPKSLLVHRLVCLAFLGEPPADRPDVNHDNGDKADNALTNLEWSNDSLNVTHAHRVLGIEHATTRPWLGKSGAAHPRSKPVIRTAADGAETTFAGISDAARQTGLQFQKISACCVGKRKRHGGFQWRFLEGNSMAKTNPPIRQGDVLLQPVSQLPPGCIEVPHDKGRIVLAYGEVTGHAHAIADHTVARKATPGAAAEIAEAAIARAKARLWKAPDGATYLEVIAPVTLRHEEHTAHEIPPGIYLQPTQVEHSPSELRRVED